MLISVDSCLVDTIDALAYLEFFKLNILQHQNLVQQLSHRALAKSNLFESISSLVPDAAVLQEGGTGAVSLCA